jgi:uncharacterized protein (DUF58 family)
MILGLALLLFGWRIGASDLLGLGAAVLIALLVSVMCTQIWFGNHQAEIVRRAPRRLVRGQVAQVTVTALKSPGLGNLATNSLTDLANGGLQASQASVEFAGKNTNMAYTIPPERSGHWQLGPLKCQVRDPLGALTTTRLLGEPSRLVVWPRLTALPVSGAFQSDSLGFGGALSAAPDDSTLREYSPGDDLRRIHWPTTARKGIPMIRENGARGLPPIQILIDPNLLSNSVVREWALEHGASVACSLLESGHPVRILGIDNPEYIESQTIGREQLLNQIAELATTKLSQSDLSVSDKSIPISNGKRGAITYGVLAANYQPPARFTKCYGIVLGSDRAATETLTRLRRCGWKAIQLARPVPHRQAWAALTCGSVREKVAA